LPASLVFSLLALGAAWCVHEAQYVAFSAPAGRLIVRQAGLERAVSITVAGFDRGRTPACTDAAVLAEFRAWLRQATGQRQREPGGPTPLEQWFVTLDDGSEAQIAWWDLKSTWEGTPVPTITGEVMLGREQCLLRLPRDEFYRLRERMRLAARRG
jgi:hypothetical protein